MERTSSHKGEQSDLDHNPNLQVKKVPPLSSCPIEWESNFTRTMNCLPSNMTFTVEASNPKSDNTFLTPRSDTGNQQERKKKDIQVSTSLSTSKEDDSVGKNDTDNCNNCASNSLSNSTESDKNKENIVEDYVDKKLKPKRYFKKGQKLSEKARKTKNKR